MRTMRYITSLLWQKGKEELLFTLDRKFRPTHIRTGVTAYDQATLSGIYINGNPNSDLLGTLDCYLISNELDAKIKAEFYKEHGLVGKDWTFIEDYLDEHDLEVPGIMRLELPTIKARGTIRLTGVANIDFIVSILGIVVE